MIFVGGSPRPNNKAGNVMTKAKRNYVRKATGSFSELLAKKIQTTGAKPRIRATIEQVMGKQLPDLIRAACDKNISSASIHQVLLSMGIKVSYIHLHKTIRPEMVADYGYYYDMMNDETAQAPMFSMSETNDAIQ